MAFLQANPYLAQKYLTPQTHHSQTPQRVAQYKQIIMRCNLQRKIISIPVDKKAFFGEAGYYLSR